MCQAMAACVDYGLNPALFYSQIIPCLTPGTETNIDSGLNIFQQHSEEHDAFIKKPTHHVITAALMGLRGIVCCDSLE